jgi:hypothetical protein
LTALAQAQVYAHTDFPLLALVANNELHALSPELAAPSLTLREQSRGLLLQVLTSGVRQGVFDLDDVVLASIAMGSMGVRVANWFGPDQPYDREQVAKSFAAFTLRLAGVGFGPQENRERAWT